MRVMRLLRLSPLVVGAGVSALAVCAAGLHAQPSPAPMPVLSHAVGYYDPHLRRAVVVGDAGDPTGEARDRAWSWSGTRWDLVTTSGPAGRTNAGGAYDRSRSRAVVAGGARKGADGQWRIVGDSWTTSGAAWRPIGEIPSRDHNTLVETRGGGVLMFGGIGADRSAAWPGDTWELRGDAWVRVATEGPGGRGRTAMAFDRARNEVVLFGGVSAPEPDQSQTFLSDTWIWNGTGWRKAADGGPRGRYAHAMTFDERKGVVLLYSGAGAHKGAPLDDLWQWDGKTWREIPLSGPTPGHRYQPVLVYDPARDRSVLVGGLGGHEDTWEWDSARWHRVVP
jgi:hypothetical protein